MSRRLQLRNGTSEEWNTVNPILAEGEPGIVLGSDGNFVIGDGKTPYKELTQHAWGWDAYDVLVHYGDYVGTREDFCRQLQSSLKTPEQQVGTLTNDGAGWNTFTFVKEFTEEVYVFLIPQDSTLFASVKNITKQSFQYCLFDADGNTTNANVVVNYLAISVSEMNMAHSIAKAVGLNPFDYDNLTVLFNDHAEEVVANSTAFNLVKTSSVASCKYLCYLTGLNKDTYYNMVSIAENETAMNTVVSNPVALSYIQSAKGAFDSIRMSSMAMAKVICALLSMDYTNYHSVDDLLGDARIMSDIANNAAVMSVCVNSELTINLFANNVIMASVMVDSEICMNSIMANQYAKRAFNTSEVAVGKYIAKKAGIDHTLYGDINVLFENTANITTIINNRDSATALCENSLAFSTLMKYTNYFQTLCTKDSYYYAYVIAKNEDSIDALIANQAACDAISSYTTFGTIITASLMGIELERYDSWNYIFGYEDKVLKFIECDKAMIFASKFDYAMQYLNNSSYMYRIIPRDLHAIEILGRSVVAIRRMFWETIPASPSETSKTGYFWNNLDDEHTACAILIRNKQCRAAILSDDCLSWFVLYSQSSYFSYVWLESAELFHTLIKSDKKKWIYGSDFTSSGWMFNNTSTTGYGKYSNTYKRILELTSDERYFTRYIDYVATNSSNGFVAQYNTTDGMSKTPSTTANASLFIAFKAGTTTSHSSSHKYYVYLSGLYGKDMGGISISSSIGGQNSDELSLGGSPVYYIVLGGVRMNANYVYSSTTYQTYAYVRGWFVYAK